MNFYKEQDKSKRHAAVLTLFFILSVVVVVFTVGMVFITICLYVFNEGLLLTLSPFYILSNSSWFVIIYSFLGVFFIIAYGVVKKFDELEKGGCAVANQLGGRLLSHETINQKERTLLNIVEEMSIASGISPLPIYIIDGKHINAFVAGSSYDNAVFGITRGAVSLLDRDELQGVIAHEFSHIFNGDMKLNNYITGCVSGIAYIFIIGMELMFPSEFAEDDERAIAASFAYNKNAFLLMFCGFLMAIFGVAGMACASFIQLLINRQREYLADAYAVQFTRYPNGIANALKKVGRYGYKLPSANVCYFNHIFFASWSSPATEKRILKIEPRWDGNYIITSTKKPPSPSSFERLGGISQKFQPATTDTSNNLTIAYVLNQLISIGNIDNKQLLHARKVLDSIPQELKQSAQNPLEAEFIIYALLLDTNADVRRMQVEMIARRLFTNDPQKQETARRRLELIYGDISFLERSGYLNIIHICITALKTLSTEQYVTFKELTNEIIEYDKHISVFEWCIRYIVLYPLDITFGFRKPPLETHAHIEAFQKELEILLSAFSYMRCKNDKKAALIYENVKKQGIVTSLRYIPYDEFSKEDFAKIIDKIQNSKPLARRKVMELVLLSLSDDGEICHQDLAVIHALSEALHLPLGIET
ncbi:MAG: M48 family metalloprotease [Campylobacteraceae bacterium]|jgi:Zn-dependent protease with chaperone function|nr:M48 family metalloprotease [Campylobacteraceae bacterium]